MRASIIKKLKALTKRHQELSSLLATKTIIDNQPRYRELAKEYTNLHDLVMLIEQYDSNQQAIDNTTAMLNDQTIPELHSLATEELLQLQQTAATLSEQIQLLLLPDDPSDQRNIFLEIRAGAGGDEAAIFAGDLFRMYSRYVEKNGWQLELINSSYGEHGGFKNIIVRIIGKGVYARLKFESGVHRVQRVPETEAQGRIHTSTCTIAIMAEAEELDQIEINPTDLKIDTYRSSGAGGQHVNVTDSAIRITHLPTGVVVECQDERSQHKNRARAMSLLQARLLAAEREKQEREQAATRRSLVGTGDRSERIRTYNFPQGRLTDHRINLTSYQLDKVMNGEIDFLIDALLREHQADQLTALASSNEEADL